MQTFQRRTYGTSAPTHVDLKYPIISVNKEDGTRKMLSFHIPNIGYFHVAVISEKRTLICPNYSIRETLFWYFNTRWWVQSINLTWRAISYFWGQHAIQFRDGDDRLQRNHVAWIRKIVLEIFDVKDHITSVVSKK